MKQLVISKIGVSADGVKHLDCGTPGLSNPLPEVEKYPDLICFLGDHFYKYDCDFKCNVVHYQTR